MSDRVIRRSSLMTAVRQDAWHQRFRARPSGCGPPDLIGENPPVPRLGQSLTRRIEPLPRVLTQAKPTLTAPDGSARTRLPIAAQAHFGIVHKLTVRVNFAPDGVLSEFDI
jgi:hypothetical protein